MEVCNTDELKQVAFEVYEVGRHSTGNCWAPGSNPLLAKSLGATFDSCLNHPYSHCYRPSCSLLHCAITDIHVKAA